MTTHSFKITTTAAWVSLVVCSLVFVYIAFTTADTVLINGAKDGDDSVHEVRSSTDIHYLQERAAGLIQLSAFTSSLSMLLCRLALGALLIAMICSGVDLVQIRKMRRRIDETQNAG
jgi:hypothetical protein